MKKIYGIVIIPILLGIICFSIYSIIGSHVAPDGMLIEPFFLLPIGILGVGIGIVSAIILASIKIFHKKQK
jgi:hypothetical protein